MKLIASLLTALLISVMMCAVAVALEAKIIGGDPVQNNQFNFVVALLNETKSGGPANQLWCTATLLDHNSVLTAAHCVIGIPPSELSVTLGRTVLSSDRGYIRPVTAKSIHPQFRKTCHNCNDVAVLTFAPSVQGVPTIKIGGAALETPGRILFVAGWGSTDPGRREFPDRMRFAEVPVVSDQEAKSVWESRYVGTLMVAAGGERKDTCEGDSGGPLFDMTATGPKQIGVTSFGADPCAEKKMPGVYTEINSPSIKSFILTASAN
jgi:secreted trypsin-like serine protease